MGGMPALYPAHGGNLRGALRGMYDEYGQRAGWQGSLSLLGRLLNPPTINPEASHAGIRFRIGHPHRLSHAHQKPGGHLRVMGQADCNAHSLPGTRQ